KRGMYQVRSRMMLANFPATLLVHHRLPLPFRMFGKFICEMDITVGGFLNIQYAQVFLSIAHHAGVGHLTTAFSIKRCSIKYNFVLLVLLAHHLNMTLRSQFVVA